MSLKFYGDGRVENLVSVDVELDDIQDVDLTTSPPQDGNALIYDAQDQEWQAGPGGPSTTDDLNEGAQNLYYTDQRADARISAADTDDISEGQNNLYYTDARALAVAVDKTGDTMTGILTAKNFHIPVVVQFTYPSEVMQIDFSNGPGLINHKIADVYTTYNQVYSGTNYTAGSIITIFVENTMQSNATLQFPAGWKFANEKPTQIDALSSAVFTLTCFTNTESGVVAGWQGLV